MGAAENNKQVIQQAFDAWAAGEGGVFDLLAPEAQWTIVGNSVVAGTYHSREEFLSKVIRPFNARMATPLVPNVHALYADGDTVIAYFDASATVRDGSPLVLAQVIAPGFALVSAWWGVSGRRSCRGPPTWRVGVWCGGPPGRLEAIPASAGRASP
jgi:ketosteroid isomerase-like protein